MLKKKKKAIATNRRAGYDYKIGDKFEAGIVLKGSEVKSLRSGRANISESYAIDKNGEIFLIKSHGTPTGVMVIAIRPRVRATLAKISPITC